MRYPWRDRDSSFTSSESSTFKLNDHYRWDVDKRLHSSPRWYQNDHSQKCCNASLCLQPHSMSTSIDSHTHSMRKRDGIICTVVSASRLGLARAIEVSWIPIYSRWRLNTRYCINQNRSLARLARGTERHDDCRPDKHVSEHKYILDTSCRQPKLDKSDNVTRDTLLISFRAKLIKALPSRASYTKSTTHPLMMLSNRPVTYSNIFLRLVDTGCNRMTQTRKDVYEYTETGISVPNQPSWGGMTKMSKTEFVALRQDTTEENAVTDG